MVNRSLDWLRARARPAPGAVDADEPFGFWVAFLPRSAGEPHVEVIAYDDSGRVLSRIDYRA